MTDKEEIEKILNYYDKLKKEYEYYEKNNMNTDFADGELCGIREILDLLYNYNIDKE